MTTLAITDVSLRDGLQTHGPWIATDDKFAIARALAAAGVASLELTSFVSPKAVPQMADAAELVRRAHDLPALRTSVLVPNLTGLRRAVEAGATEIAVVVAATDAMNRANIRAGLAEAIEMGTQTLRAARAAGLATRAYLATAFECPFEGLVTPEAALAVAMPLVEAGAQELVLADTIGAAAPPQVRTLVERTAARVPIERLALHLHDTRGLGAANAWAAIEAGVRRFDSSLGGLGGCPFAPGAAGNLATEDLVLLAQQAGFDTGIALARLAGAVDSAQALLGRPLGGRCMPWLRRRLAGELRREDDHEHEYEHHTERRLA